MAQDGLAEDHGNPRRWHGALFTGKKLASEKQALNRTASGAQTAWFGRAACRLLRSTDLFENTRKLFMGSIMSRITGVRAAGADRLMCGSVAVLATA